MLIKYLMLHYIISDFNYIVEKIVLIAIIKYYDRELIENL